MNELVNGKFTTTACGPIKPGGQGDIQDDENDCERGGERERGGESRVEDAGN